LLDTGLLFRGAARAHTPCTLGRRAVVRAGHQPTIEHMTRMARTERLQLCDVALTVGEDQPTLSGEWDVKQLVVHLLLRERSPAAAGIVLSPLSRLTDRESRRIGRQPFNVLVERLRSGPPAWSPYAVPKLDALFNTLEFFVHHEDIRRAQPEWSPRVLSDDDEKLLWSMVRTAAKAMVRSAPTGVVLENAVTGSRVTVKGAQDLGSVVVSGRPSEVTLFAFGRQAQAQVTLDGPDEATAALAAASLGV
jgi:uncharacterized protein (TIGR03085 family)